MWLWVSPQPQLTQARPSSVSLTNGRRYTIAHFTQEGKWDFSSSPDKIQVQALWSEEKRKTNTKSFDNSSWFHSSQLPKTTTLLKYSEFFGFFSPSLIELFLIYAYVHLRCRVWWADTHVYCEMITKTMLTPSFLHVIIIMCVCVCVCWWHLRSILLTGLKYVIQLILVLMLPIKPPEFIHL